MNLKPQLQPASFKTTTTSVAVGACDSSASGTSRRRFLNRLFGAGGAALVLAPSPVRSANGQPGGFRSVRDFGAVGNGTTLDTKALQAAIDACAQAGGGSLLFPAGSYLTGSLFLKSRVTLYLEAGATILGSKKLDDYAVKLPAIRSYTDNYTERALIYGENLDDITIEGRGVIDGQGAAFKGPYKVRPYLMRIVGCRNIAVRGITLKDSPMWVQHYLACDGVLIDGIRVASRCNANNDGIDIDGCERVRIANCDIHSGDDAIVLKSTLDRPCRNVVVTNCVLSSDCNAFKLGTESNGGFENIAMSNCTIYDTRLSGIALEMVDGGTLERVSISNVTMRNVRNPIFIRLGNRARPFKEGMTPPGMGSLRHVRISDVQATGADGVGCSITGLPNHALEDVALENISIQSCGGGKAEDARREIPEQETKYPEYKMFGTLPAYGFFCRHAHGLRLSRVQVEVAEADARPSLVCQDVSELEIFAWRPARDGKADPAMILNDTREVFIHGCQSPPATATYVRVEGKGSTKIKLLNNDLAGAAQAVSLGPEVSPNAVAVGAGPSEAR